MMKTEARMGAKEAGNKWVRTMLEEMKSHDGLGTT